jgi:hypothetical protein
MDNPEYEDVVRIMLERDEVGKARQDSFPDHEGCGRCARPSWKRLGSVLDSVQHLSNSRHEGIAETLALFLVPQRR